MHRGRVVGNELSHRAFGPTSRDWYGHTRGPEFRVRAIEQKPCFVFMDCHHSDPCSKPVHDTRGIRPPRGCAIFVLITEQQNCIGRAWTSQRQRHGFEHFILSTRSARFRMTCVYERRALPANRIRIDNPVLDCQVRHDSNAQVRYSGDFSLSFDDADESIHGLKSRGSRDSGSSPSIRRGSLRASSERLKSRSRTISRWAVANGPIRVVPFR